MWHSSAAGADPLSDGRSDRRVGVDVGGTFTDFVVFDGAAGIPEVFKVPSVPGDPARAVVEGFERLLAGGVPPDAITLFVHGTTIGLNALLQRSGARVGLLVTRGFRDVLQLRRLRLDGAPGFFVRQPVPLVRRRDIREIDGRLLASGEELRPLDETQVVAATQELVDSGCETIAICFLHAYRNAVHEEAASRCIRERFPGLHVTASSAIWPQQREYERTEIAVINAHVAPVLERYFQRLVAALRDLGIRTPVFITRSSGGIMAASRAQRRPVETLLSGPASGVVAAAAVGEAAGVPELIAFDMGGTSADIGIVQRGELRTSTETKIGDFPVIMPAVDVTSIGAGGGSIAHIDAAGVLKVGPESAGADPGPAAYGRGGSGPTVTDAYVTLGMLDPSTFLGGQQQLDANAARTACERIGRDLDRSAEDAAEAILDVATANMFARLLPLMAQRGANPSDFSLLPYGGAGPTHAFLLAREVGFQRIVIPPTPGALSALGCLLGDVRADFVRTVYAQLDQLADEQLHGVFDGLRSEAADWLSEERVAGPAIIGFSADLRYRGQSHELAVPLPEPGAEFRGDLVHAFTEVYDRVYGTSDPEGSVELVNARAHALGSTRKPDLTVDAGHDGPSTVRQSRIYCDGAWHEATVCSRAGLRVNATLEGPALVTQYDTTTFVPPGYAVHCDEQGNLIGREAP
jgi:N-methylhydantoinase A